LVVWIIWRPSKSSFLRFIHPNFDINLKTFTKFPENFKLKEISEK
jgi:hypothetical protein